MKCPLLKRQIEKVSTRSANRSELKEYVQSFEDCYKEDCTAWRYDEPFPMSKEMAEKYDPQQSCKYNRLFLKGE